MASVAVIGGGFSGTMVAVNVARLTGGKAKIFLIEKTGEFARGVAYGTKDMKHLLNVPANRVSAFAESPDDFVRWLGPDAQPDGFYPRKIYGDYLQSKLDEAIGVEKISQEAVDLELRGNGVAVILHGGKTIEADAVVLALGNLPPSTNKFEQSLDRLKHRVFFNPWGQIEALRKIDDQAKILIIGTGLTMVDMVISLTAEKPGRKITAVSRHGFLPQPHIPNKPNYEINIPTKNSVIDSLHFLRLEVKKAAEKNIPWQAVIDALRPYTIDIWQSFGLNQKKVFTRHLRTYWDTHRHRMSPEIFANIKNLQQNGRLRIVAGRVKNIEAIEKDFEVAIKLRGGEKEIIEKFDYIINCATPENDYESNKLMKSLFNSKVVQHGVLRMGIKTGKNGEVIDSNDKQSERIFAIGPLRKGDLWETIAVPELRLQAADLAKVIVGSL